ncbi:hypothetical protein V1503_03390 [Bacillus sp. SCS-151]|uniref:hypothetical protein n=1 Tax=Nanhaiella sioensis TaxID=3115293 RepID=UPI00397A0343
MGEVISVKVDIDFEEGFELSHNVSPEEALKAVLKEIKNLSFEELEIELEYEDGNVYEYVIGEDEEDDEDEDDDDEED